MRAHVYNLFVGGSDLVYLRRGSDNTVHVRRLLPVELLALQGSARNDTDTRCLVHGKRTITIVYNIVDNCVTDRLDAQLHHERAQHAPAHSPGHGGQQLQFSEHFHHLDGARLVGGHRTVMVIMTM